MSPKNSGEKAKDEGVLFFSDIANPSGNCSKFSGDLQDCDKIRSVPDT